ncbi:MAG: hypothetical protein LBT04_09645 [Prevotellaceae bacterium]|jgi:hypothetical protein|nr:hypothetical protein [Prevotellaceae bacterium]
MRKSNIFSAILVVALVGASFISCNPKNSVVSKSIVGSWNKQSQNIDVKSSDTYLQALLDYALPELGIEFFQSVKFNEDGTGTFNDTTTFTYTKTETVVTVKASHLILDAGEYQMDLSNVPLSMEYTLTNDYNALKLDMDIIVPFKMLMSAVLEEIGEQMPFPVSVESITKANITADCVRK